MNKIATLITAFAKPNSLRANFVSALAMAFAIASCTQSELVHNDHHDLPLTFDTYVGNTIETRADGSTYVTSTTLPNGQAFGLFCYMHSGKWATAAASTNANFMYNQKVSVSGTPPAAQTFTYSPIKYWPSNSNNKLSFLAYYPHDCADITFKDAVTNADYTSSTHGMPKAHFTVQPTAADQVDFMYADLATDQTKAVGKVDFTFKHALTRLQFKAKHSGTGSVDIKITSVTVKAASKGTFDFSSQAWSGQNTEAGFPLTDYISTPLTTTATDVTTAAAADKNTLLMIPQELTNVKIEVAYTQDGDAATATLALAGSTEPWTANKSITYTLILNPGNPITFTATAGLWDDKEVELP